MRALSAALATGLALASLGGAAQGYGEAVGGWPNWQERVILQWMNRARADPQADLGGCVGAACPDKACYTPQPPLAWSVQNSHAARFHSDEMIKQSYFDHPSHCVVASNVNTTYPATCDGSAACACSGAGTTSVSARVALFGASGGAEIIAGGQDPDQQFYLWLDEQATTAACSYSSDKGHRWLILTSQGAVGVGYDAGGPYGAMATGDFGGGSPPQKLVWGTHYPQSGATTTWASWADSAGPMSALLDVDGTCSPMTLRRGSVTNGAYSADVTGSSACRRYYFVFKDSTGAKVTFPTTGSLGIGSGAGCADWDPARPVEGTGCACSPQCAGLTCVPDGCGGVCPGACPIDAGLPRDSAVPGVDAARADAGGPLPDAGPIGFDDAGHPVFPDGALSDPPGTSTGGCSCKAAGQRPRQAAVPLIVVVGIGLAVVLAGRRRRGAAVLVPAPVKKPRPRR